MHSLFTTLGFVCLVITGTAWAQAPDMVLLNGKIVSADDKGSVYQALALRDDRIVATGKSAAIKRMAGKQTRAVDLAGRTVIPGLIDSHIHAIRAAWSYTTEVHWIGVATLDEALGRLRDDEFPDGGHMTPLTRADAFNQRVAAFLDSP